MLTLSDYLFEKKFINTTTADKLAVINNENLFINHFIPTRNNSEQIVGVVGEAKSGLQRHLEQYANLGFQERNIYIFEILLHEYKNLWYTNNNVIKSFANIVMGDIFKPMMYKRTPNFDISKVTHVDADITTTLNTDLTEEVRHTFTIYPNLKSAVFVHSLRNTDLRSPEVLKYLERSYIQKYIMFLKGMSAKSKDAYVTAFRNVLEVYLTGTVGRNVMLNELFKAFPNYSFLVQNYQGRGPLTSVTVIKNTNNKIIQSNAQDLSQVDISRFNSAVSSFERFSFNNLNTRTLLHIKPAFSFTRQEYSDIHRDLHAMKNTLQNIS
jgi:hypothetical protein